MIKETDGHALAHSATKHASGLQTPAGPGLINESFNSLGHICRHDQAKRETLEVVIGENATDSDTKTKPSKQKPNRVNKTKPSKQNQTE